MIKVMHVITTLGPAGAETMLCRIAAGMDGTRFENEIVSLRDILDQAERMRAIGVRVRTLGMKKSVPNPLLVMRLARWIRESKPDVIHTWMYHANLIGALAARLAGDVPVVWGIHHSALNPGVDKHRTVFVNRICALMSRKFPARIVFCSEASLRFHKDLGYDAEKLELVPNGVDPEQFRPDPIARLSVREELGIPADALLIGMAARFHPQKDHGNFIRAAERLHKQLPQVHFLLCGLDIKWENSQLAGWVKAAGLGDCCHLLGVRQDLPRLFAAMDIATTSSISGEAFPVVVAEAMASRTPCVVTDVGDSALIVVETGRVVPPGNPDALGEAWRKLIEAGPGERLNLGMAARHRVQQHFALPVIVDRHQAIYAQVAAGTPRGTPNSSLSHYAH
jgi:glycosyltransferase involved in cell wall biosynthesis